MYNIYYKYVYNRNIFRNWKYAEKFNVNQLVEKGLFVELTKEEMNKLLSEYGTRLYFLQDS